MLGQVHKLARVPPFLGSCVLLFCYSMVNMITCYVSHNFQHNRIYSVISVEVDHTQNTATPKNAPVQHAVLAYNRDAMNIMQYERTVDMQ